MYYLKTPRLGIYEKALPAETTWPEKFAIANQTGYDFIEISIDESDHRLSRLEWSAEERRTLRHAVEDSNSCLPSMCLSGHRRFPLGSEDNKTRDRARDIMRRAIELSVDLGIRTIQLAGYDVYYTDSNARTRTLFLEGLREAVTWASSAEVMLAMEIMDYPLMNSISRFMEYDSLIGSPWLTVYPDLGNLSAWGNDVPKEIEIGYSKIVAIHLKDTLPVSGDFPGQFRDVPFGCGCVDFVAAFKKLADLNYRGPFMIEMWTEKVADPIMEITSAREWILERMSEGGYL